MIELAGSWPSAFCGRMLADMGADVTRVEQARSVRGGEPHAPPVDVLGRGRRSIGIDIDAPDGRAVLLRLAERADVVIEGLGPGAAEEAGVGPADCSERNPRLVYGRASGWGHHGPYAERPGSDINHIALAGALDPIGRSTDGPVPPLNLVGDFGGAGMHLAFGVVCALLEVRHSGAGQVVESVTVDAAASLMSLYHGLEAMGVWDEGRGTNLFDTGAPFYDVYETSDHKHITFGSVDAQGYEELLEHTGLVEVEDLPPQMDKARWPELREKLRLVVATRTRDEWCEIFERTAVCFAPVLSMVEAREHPHNRARGTFVEVAGVPQPAPAPRFSRTSPQLTRPPSHPGEHTVEILREAGYAGEQIFALLEAGIVA